MGAPLLGLAKSIYYTFLKKFGSGMLLFESRFKQRERSDTSNDNRPLNPE